MSCTVVLSRIDVLSPLPREQFRMAKRGLHEGGVIGQPLLELHVQRAALRPAEILHGIPVVWECLRRTTVLPHGSLHRSQHRGLVLGVPAIVFTWRCLTPLHATGPSVPLEQTTESTAEAQQITNT